MRVHDNVGTDARVAERHVLLRDYEATNTCYTQRKTAQYVEVIHHKLLISAPYMAIGFYSAFNNSVNNFGRLVIRQNEPF